MVKELRLNKVGPPVEEVGVMSPETGETESGRLLPAEEEPKPMEAALAVCSSYILVKLAGESGISEVGLDGTLVGVLLTVVCEEETVRRAPVAGACLLLRILSLNLRSMVSRSLRRLWLTVLRPIVCVIRARDEDILASEVKPPFWFGVLVLLLLVPLPP